MESSGSMPSLGRQSRNTLESRGKVSNQTGQQNIYGDVISGMVNSAVFGKLIASGPGNGMVRLWDTVTGAPHGEPLKGHSDWVSSVAFSPDGKLVASGSQDDTVRLWDTAMGAHAEPLKGHSDSGRVSSVAFSPNGKLVASGHSGPG